LIHPFICEANAGNPEKWGNRIAAISKGGVPNPSLSPIIWGDYKGCSEQKLTFSYLKG
jgi:hypothetical protein